MRQFKEKRVSFLQVLTRLLCPEAQLSLHTKGGETLCPPPPIEFCCPHTSELLSREPRHRDPSIQQPHECGTEIGGPAEQAQ